MPEYRNNSDAIIAENGISIYPGESKSIPFFLYHGSLQKISNSPIPKSIISSGTFSLALNAKETVNLENILKTLAEAGDDIHNLTLQIYVYAKKDVMVFLDSEESAGILVPEKSPYIDEFSPTRFNVFSIKALNDATEGFYSVKIKR